MRRSEAREAVFSLVFQTKFQPENMYSMLQTYFEENPTAEPHKNYIESIVCGVSSKLHELDCLIEGNSQYWSIDRMSLVCLAAMRISLYEMLYIDDVPAVIAIDECIRMVKKYEGHTALAFLNGVLDNIKEKLGKK